MRKYIVYGLITIGLAFIGFIVAIGPRGWDAFLCETSGCLKVSYASIALNEGAQVADAWKQYLEDHQNNPPITSVDLVRNKYMSEDTTYPVFDSIWRLEMAISKNKGHYFAYADMGFPRKKNLAGKADDPHAVYCDKIIRVAFGADKPGITGYSIMTTAAPGTIYNSNGATTPTSGNGVFGCAYTNAPTGNTVGGTAIPAGHYVMEYLLQ